MRVRTEEYGMGRATGGQRYGEDEYMEDFRKVAVLDGKHSEGVPTQFITFEMTTYQILFLG